MRLIYKENPYHARSLLADCAEITAANISLEKMKELIQLMYSKKVVFKYDHKCRCERVSFELTDRSTWNEYTVSDGREIGIISEGSEK